MKKILLIVCIVVIVGAAILALLNTSLHTTRDSTISKLVRYSLNVDLIEEKQFIEYRLGIGQLYAELEYLPEQCEEVLARLRAAISFNEKQKDYLDKIKNEKYFCADRIDAISAKDIYVFEGRMSGSPDSVVVVICEEWNCYLYAIIDYF